MGKFENLNRGKRLFDIDVKGAPFLKLSDLHSLSPDAVYPLEGFYVNRKSEYGEHYVIITNGFTTIDGDYVDHILVDAPQHMNSVFSEIASNPDLMQAVKRGECGFRVYMYDAKTRKGCYGIELVDIVPESEELDLLFDRGTR